MNRRLPSRIQSKKHHPSSKTPFLLAGRSLQLLLFYVRSRLLLLVLVVHCPQSTTPFAYLTIHTFSHKSSWTSVVTTPTTSRTARGTCGFGRTCGFGVSPTSTTTTSTPSLTTALSLSRRRDELSSSLTHTLDSYETLTVKELRQMVKDQSDGERGVVSKLKRKQDLIDYLASTTTVSASEMVVDSTAVTAAATAAAAVDTTLSEGEAQEQEQPQLKKQETKMPPSVSITNELEATSLSVTSPAVVLQRMPPISNGHRLSPVQRHSHKNYPPSSPPPSPKDAILEQVFQRYPTLLQHPSVLDNNNDSLSNIDLRQVYHPLLKSNTTTCDMDLVFVGTASCTPGTTRGVSCTALRLNWKRRGPRWGVTPTPSSSAATKSTASKKETQDSASNQGFPGGTWLFDVGECTQLQVQRVSEVKPSKITKIFVTHAHGDHSFGLPGLLCLMGQDRERSTSNWLDANNNNNGAAAAPSVTPVDIYGPEGLRMWLRVAIRYSVSRIVPPYRVHELKHVPMAPEWEFNARTRRFFYRGFPPNQRRKSWGEQGLAGEDPTNWISQANQMPLQPSVLYGEVEGGRDIYPMYNHPMSSDGAPVWEVEDEDDVKVFAAPMSHGIPCVGYVVEELPQPGRLRSELVEPLVRRNVQALKEAGFAVPMKAMGVIKSLEPGTSFTFPDGTVLTQDEAVEPPRAGRKVVICGDTADCRALLKLAQNADVVVHEATNTYLAGVDKDSDLRSTTRDAIVHGHSTPYMAGEFARAIKAKKLILNHFSARYKGDISPDSLSIMMRIEKQAMQASGLDETKVAAAWDLMILPIHKEPSKSD